MHASRGDENVGDTDRSAFKEASDARKRKRARILRKQAKVRLVTKGSYCTDYNKPGHYKAQDLTQNLYNTVGTWSTL